MCNKPECFGHKDMYLVTVGYCLRNGCNDVEREKCFYETLNNRDKEVSDEHEY